MQMKDKIYRTNHKKGYYYMKKIGIFFGSIISATILLAIPVSIVRSILSNENIQIEASTKNECLDSNENLLKF